MMTCHLCKEQLVDVGTHRNPKDRLQWVRGYICSTKTCYGFAQEWSSGTVVRYPALSLDKAVPIHAAIEGAMLFRDSVGMAPKLADAP